MKLTIQKAVKREAAGNGTFEIKANVIHFTQGTTVYKWYCQNKDDATRQLNAARLSLKPAELANTSGA